MAIFLTIVVLGALGLMAMAMIFDSNPFERKNELGDLILKLFKERNDWYFTEYTATIGELEIWISNRPYADLKFGNLRIGNMWQRREIRKIMDEKRAHAIINLANKVKKNAK